VGSVSVVAATDNPKRVLSPEQEAAMLRREEVVLAERGRGRSFYKMERAHPSSRHTWTPPGEQSAVPCDCNGISNPDRIWRRAINREENVGWRRAEAIRLEEQRLDELQEGIWDKALAGDARAVEVALKVLERRARMLGLDFADYLSGQMVEIEQAKVKLMATALVKALNAADATQEQKRAATTAFFAELRATEADDGVHTITSLPAPGLTDEDRSLL
jgi:hypothetical protein